MYLYHYKWCFSIAMLVYRSVNGYQIRVRSIKIQAWKSSKCCMTIVTIGSKTHHETKHFKNRGAMTCETNPRNRRSPLTQKRASDIAGFLKKKHCGHDDDDKNDNPIGSMGLVYVPIHLPKKNQPNVGNNSIHGWYGQQQQQHEHAFWRERTLTERFLIQGSSYTKSSPFLERFPPAENKKKEETTRKPPA